MRLKFFPFQSDRHDCCYKIPLIRDLALGFLVFMIVQIGMPPKASAQKWDAFPPKSKYAKKIQKAWRDIGCYAGKIDGVFGDASLAAKENWIDTLGDDFPEGAFNSRNSVLSFLKEQKKKTKKFCPSIISSTKSTSKAGPKPAFSTAYPNNKNKKAVKNIQELLFDKGCFGNQLTRAGEVDKQFGDRSKRAFWVFAETFKRKFNASSLNIPKLSQDIFNTILNNKAVAVETQFCSEFGKDLLKKWFTDKNHHIPGEARSERANACDMHEVARLYFQKLPASMEQGTLLSTPLNFVVENFPKLFDEKKFFKPTTDEALGWDEEEPTDEKIPEETAEEPSPQTSQNTSANDKNKTPATPLERYKAYALPADTFEDVKKALEMAQQKFLKTAFRYGLEKKPACGTCVLINDFMFLKNIAQADGGNIVHTDEDGIPTNFKVTAMTKEALENVRGNIYLYRRMTAKWNLLVKQYQVQSEKDNNAEKVNLLRTELIKVNKARKQELLILAAELINHDYDEDESGLMKSLATEFDCIGFNGSALD